MDSIDAASPSYPPKILFVDAFDSFANNIVGLLEECLHAHVTLVHVDDAKINDDLAETLSGYDAVVIGPGPGHPGIPSDVGFITKLWEVDKEHELPILGICLGFQSLCLSHGAAVKKLPFARHGIVTKPVHNDTDIFAGIGRGLQATQYHSLRVDLRGNSSEVATEGSTFWEPTVNCPALHPLAWDVSDASNGPILMAVRHSTKPLWGVQFHPESICTSDEGKQLVVNWWTSAKAWLSERGRTRSLHKEKLTSSVGDGLPPTLEFATAGSSPWDSPTSDSSTSHLAGLLRSVIEEDDIVLRWGRNSAANINPTSLVDALGHSRDEFVLLDSQNHPTGRYSILGFMVPGKTMKVTYSVSDKTLQYGIIQGNMCTMQLHSIDEVWPMLQDALSLHDPRTHEMGSSRASSSTGSDVVSTGLDQYVAGHLPTESPFWGGFMGYISYEAGLETIDVKPHTSTVPDINFAFMHRSIVIDHQTSSVYIQSLLPQDWTWIRNVEQTINKLASQPPLPTGGSTIPQPSTPEEAQENKTLDQSLKHAHISRPKEPTYRAKVLRCQDYLANGDSYELCLTDSTTITTTPQPPLNPWTLYKRLRANNAAPFGAFLRLSHTTVASSSPERFLSWTRDGKCQFRPIKGTVKKTPLMTRAHAHALLASDKERAENLMIVDLIRHDLSGVVGAANTYVEKLMVVEEYETVFQLVSVIEGYLPPHNNGLARARASGSGSVSGIDVLKSSLPPGSMTGAPKKRSCEILSTIEQRPRGVYSGVLGYLDVGGAGDFSVVIRTAVKNQLDERGERGERGDDVWRVGAGGAVTVLSTDEGEFREMETKCESVLEALLMPRGARVG
ncbi:para-aminobenzoate synthase [Periconia macrospinosa]|uniref:aminodeoxychorismate synthase n=1 Tax=Periconia macrospinosa TaxID=97972 RepID=A0A2V1DKT6_9PLEO|nr:para-aminobenzoate synthase [Periconia macrospinosa]